MTFFPHSLFGLFGRSGAATDLDGLRLRPVWLRPTALLVVACLHASLFFAWRAPASRLTPLDAVEVALEPLGDAPEDQQAVADVAPSQPPPDLTEPAPEADVVEPPPPPQIVAPEAMPPPQDRPAPKPKPRPIATPRQKAPAETAREEGDERREAQQGRRAARRGVAEGASTSGGLSHAAYAALLAAEIRRRTFYPSAARATGATGSVGVAFTIGPSGRVTSMSIASSSGDAALDGAARAILRAVHTPPPPGGHFSASTSIRFHLN